MKKALICSAITGSLLFAASAATLLSFNHSFKKVNAYTTSSLPTTIDLNDPTTSEIRNYYSNLNILSSSEKTGTNLLKNLKPILKNGQKYYAYDSSSTIWNIYEIADRDWDLSPASSTVYGTYNSSTNTITDYEYGSNSDNKNNPYVHSLYTNRNVTNEAKAWGDHSQTNWGINREHVWPKSQGFDGEGDGGARGDPMHLISGNGYANNIHSNYFYGYVDTDQTYTDCGSKYEYLGGNLRGISKTIGSGTVFEPQDSDKGDIARAIFYMVARYNYLSGSDADGIDENNPNLQLVEDSYMSSSYTSSTTNPGKMGIISDLLEWNRLDKPDAFEIHRNNLLFKNFTNNRNPFIDFPEWADYIWGDKAGTVSANPQSDTLNDFGGGSTPSDYVTLNKSSVTMTVGDTETLTANANSSVNWSSSNTSVVTVNNGTLTAVSAGTATITATCGTASATCSVTVNAAPIIVTSDYSLTSGSPFINGCAYKMYQDNSGVVYFSGGMSNTYYGSYSASISNAVDVFFEENGNGQNIYFDNNGTKSYFYVYLNGTYVNSKYGSSVPSQTWTYNSTYGCMTYVISGTPYTFGTYGTYKTFSAFSVTDKPTNIRFSFVSTDGEGSLALSCIIRDYVVCDATGNTSPTFGSGGSWSAFEGAYNYLSSTDKSTLQTTSANKNGGDLQQGLARYDYVVGKYGTSTYSDFLNRNPASFANRINLPIDFTNRSFVVTLVAMFTVSVLSFVLYFSFRNNKRDIIKKK